MTDFTCRSIFWRRRFLRASSSAAVSVSIGPITRTRPSSLNTSRRFAHRVFSTHL
ncbi:MAG: twin-arginine translocation signal domain-containing protein [Phenylobacterium sp.]|nr:MAG: twin-arginine translocation signal domain-containing protein [Phenylobacterium sp.]